MEDLQPRAQVPRLGAVPDLLAGRPHACRNETRAHAVTSLPARRPTAAARALRMRFDQDAANPPSRVLRFCGAVKRDPAIEVWLRARGELGAIARRWFDVMRGCGDDVSELLHDGHPTACIGDAAFGYVNAFTAHVNVGFFRGAEIADPSGLLEGTGRFMRHVKLRPDREIDAAALAILIEAAYADMRRREQAL